MNINIVTFKCENTIFGIDINYVQGIINIPEKITKVPESSDEFVGIINIRDSIVSIIDWRYVFYHKKNDISKLNKIIIIEHEDTKIGFIVDEILSVFHKEDITLQKNELFNDFSVEGILQNDDKMIVILDIKSEIRRYENV